MDEVMQGVLLTPLRRIEGEFGNIYHCLKYSDEGFVGFGEAYFSTVKLGKIKGWKQHLQMTLNLVVVVGKIRFVVCELGTLSDVPNRYYQVDLHAENYARLTILPGLWMAFQGLGEPENILINIASLPHDPKEQINVPLGDSRFSSYVWA